MVQGIGPTGGDSGSISGMVEYQVLYKQYQSYIMQNSDSNWSFEDWLLLTGKLVYFNQWTENYIESGGKNFTNGDGVSGNTISGGSHVNGGSSAIYQSSDDETYYQFNYETGEYRVLHGNEEIAAALGLPEGTNIDMIEFGTFSAQITDITFGGLDDGQDATNFRVNGNYHGVTMTDQEFDIHYILNALLMDPTDPQYQIAKAVFDKLCANTNQWLPQSDLDMLNEVAEKYGTESAEYKAVLKDVLLSNLDQANEWVEDHTHVAHNQASLDEIGTSGAGGTNGTEGSESTEGDTNSPDNTVPDYSKEVVLNNAGVLKDYTQGSWSGTKVSWKNDAGKDTDKCRAMAQEQAMTYATGVLDSIEASLISQLGESCTDEIKSYIAKAKTTALEKKDWLSTSWESAMLGKNRGHTGHCNTKLLVDTFFNEFNTLCANGGKSTEEVAAEEQAKQEQAAKEEAVFKELYSMDIGSMAKDAGVDKDAQVVNPSSASEIQAKAESDILQPLMNKIKAQLSGKGLSDADIDSVLQQCASYALSYCTEWASTSNNYVYTIDADKLIDKFEEAVKEIVKNKGYAV